jgi:protein TonB
VAPAGINAEQPQPQAGWEASTSSIGLIDDNFDTQIAPPPAPVETAPPAPVRVGAGVRAPQKLREVNPVYPPIAQAARVQGIVIIEATISEGGSVTNARILRSVPLLDQAALDAVRQWQFTPTLLNGVPVPVIMSVTVNFTLR